MKTIMVRYKTKENEAENNARLIQAVFEELRALGTKDVRYSTFRLPDGVSFMHVATVETQGNNPLTNLPAFKEFVRDIKERCVEPPVTTELTVLQSYG